MSSVLAKKVEDFIKKWNLTLGNTRLEIPNKYSSEMGAVTLINILRHKCRIWSKNDDEKFFTSRRKWNKMEIIILEMKYMGIRVSIIENI